MSGIFGLVRRNGAPVGDALSTMRAAMPRWGPDGFGEWSDDDAGLGQARTFSMPESQAEALPIHDAIAGFAFTAAGRLDNRAALIAELDLPERGRDLPDSGVMMAAYRRWGDDAPPRLLGDWSFAAWHPAQRRLFLARDLLGHAALYYCCDRHTVAFSASLRALLALGLTPIELDELYLAQYLISWPRYHGERTASSAARRLTPAHTLTVRPEEVNKLLPAPGGPARTAPAIPLGLRGRPARDLRRGGADPAALRRAGGGDAQRRAGLKRGSGHGGSDDARAGGEADRVHVGPDWILA